MLGYMTSEEAAKFLSYNPARLRALARDGKIPCIKRGRAWLFKKEELEEHYRNAPGSVLLKKKK